MLKEILSNGLMTGPYGEDGREVEGRRTRTGDRFHVFHELKYLKGIRKGKSVNWPTERASNQKQTHLWLPFFIYIYSYFEIEVVGKSPRNNPVRYCGWFWVRCFSKEFERMAREVMDICLWVLKESNKSRFDSCSVSNSILIMYHLDITFRDCRAHIFSDNLSQHVSK